MDKSQIDAIEKNRLCVVQDLRILDTEPEERFDRITKEAQKIFSVPISTITIIDADREWYKSVQGLTKRQAPRDTSFCTHAMQHEDIYIIEDTLKDQLFSKNPQVIGDPFIRFYAGKSLHDRKSGLRVGVFCIKDIKPRQMSLAQIDEFLRLATQAEDELNTPTKNA